MTTEMRKELEGLTSHYTKAKMDFSDISPETTIEDAERIEKDYQNIKNELSGVLLDLWELGFILTESKLMGESR